MNWRSEVERPPGFVFRKHRKGLLRSSETFILHFEDVPLAKLA